jgi:hypothetical protein
LQSYNGAAKNNELIKLFRLDGGGNFR